jgi:hypothetical protein
MLYFVSANNLGQSYPILIKDKNFEVVFGGRKTTLIAFNPLTIGCAVQL